MVRHPLTVLCFYIPFSHLGTPKPYFFPKVLFIDAELEAVLEIVYLFPSPTGTEFVESICIYSDI